MIQQVKDKQSSNTLKLIFLFEFHKFYGGSISMGSELQLEVAEFLWRNVQVTISSG